MYFSQLTLNLWLTASIKTVTIVSLILYILAVKEPEANGIFTRAKLMNLKDLTVSNLMITSQA